MNPNGYRTMRSCSCARLGRIDPVCPHCRGSGEIVMVVEADAPPGAVGAPLPVPPPPKAPRPSVAAVQPGSTAPPPSPVREQRSDVHFRRLGAKSAAAKDRGSAPRRRIVTLKSTRTPAGRGLGAGGVGARHSQAGAAAPHAKAQEAVREGTPKVEATRDHWRANIRDLEGKFASTPMHDDYGDDSEP